MFFVAATEHLKTVLKVMSSQRVCDLMSMRKYAGASEAVHNLHELSHAGAREAVQMLHLSMYLPTYRPFACRCMMCKSPLRIEVVLCRSVPVLVANGCRQALLFDLR